MTKPSFRLRVRAAVHVLRGRPIIAFTVMVDDAYVCENLLALNNVYIHSSASAFSIKVARPNPPTN